MSTSSDRQTPAKKSGSSEIPLLEWIIGAIGLVIVALAVGVLIYEAVAGDKSPPNVKLTVQSIEPMRHRFLVRVLAENEGGEPAARVAITAELRKESTVLETGETQFEFLPSHSSREAGVFFTQDPRQGEIHLRARGYEEP